MFYFPRGAGKEDAYKAIRRLKMSVFIKVFVAACHQIYFYQWMVVKSALSVDREVFVKARASVALSTANCSHKDIRCAF